MSWIERVARWSAQRPWRVLAIWVLLVAGIAYAGSQVGTKPIDQLDEYSGESREAAVMIDNADMSPPPTEIVLITGSDVGDADGARYASLLATAARDITGVSDVQWDGDPFVAPTGAARFINVELDDARSDEQQLTTARALAKVVADTPAPAGMRGQQFGGVTLDDDIGSMVGEDLARSELITLPITLVILFITFGALVAAGLPLLIGLVSVFAAISAGALVSHLVPYSEFAPNLVTMLGIALGVDYTLFLLRREREERAAGASKLDAIGRAAATSGHAVLVSGIVVAVAMSGLLVSGEALFISMGVMAMVVVALVVLAALFVVPALLGLLGDRVEQGRVPFMRRRDRRHEGRARRSAWEPIARFAVRHRVLTFTVVTGAFVAASLPVLGMETGDTALDSFPKDKPSLVAAAQFEQHFPGGMEPASVIVHHPDTTVAEDRELAAALRTLERRAQASDFVTGAADRTTSKDGYTTVIDVPIKGFDDRDTADSAITSLRALVATTLAPVTDRGVEVAVGGDNASSLDWTTALTSRMPFVFTIVLGTAFMLLLVAFRSVVVPIVAIMLNLLSVGAAYGFLVWGFQHGALDPVLGVAENGTVVSWMPLFLFALLFGLSMDYYIFMMSRIRERYDAGASMRDAIVSGVASSASTISSAALIMVGVFTAFAFARLPEMQQMGAGLAVAILIDATIVRGLLLPATLAVLGDRTWYLPAWMQRQQRPVTRVSSAHASTVQLEDA